MIVGVIYLQSNYKYFLLIYIRIYERRFYIQNSFICKNIHREVKRKFSIPMDSALEKTS